MPSAPAAACPGHREDHRLTGAASAPRRRPLRHPRLRSSRHRIVRRCARVGRRDHALGGAGPAQRGLRHRVRVLERSRTVTAAASASSDARVTRAWDVLVVVVANAIVAVGLWLRHGGLDTFGGPGGPLIAAGQLTALIGTYAVLIELLLMSRIA